MHLACQQKCCLLESSLLSLKATTQIKRRAITTGKVGIDAAQQHALFREQSAKRSVPLPYQTVSK
jgi:hypothetical protein